MACMPRRRLQLRPRLGNEELVINHKTLLYRQLPASCRQAHLPRHGPIKCCGIGYRLSGSSSSSLMHPDSRSKKSQPTRRTSRSADHRHSSTLGQESLNQSRQSTALTIGSCFPSLSGALTRKFLHSRPSSQPLALGLPRFVRGPCGGAGLVARLFPATPDGP